MKTSEELYEKVNTFIDKLTYNREPKSLYDPIKYVLSLGGKRIRPVLMLLGYNLWKDDPERILMPAVAVETYHNYTLLHDDLMDNADKRRGHDTVHKKWDANTAILSGDAMLVVAYQRLASVDQTKLKPVLDLFTETALEIDEGQQFDIDFENRSDVKEEEYIEMIRLKTSVLLACALKIGAILANAPVTDAEALYKFGEQLGLAFQLQDDLLDVYGDFETFGKRIGGDILCNKKTYLLINALLGADESQRSELLAWINAVDFVEEEKIAAVTRIYDAIGVRALCENLINDYFGQAKVLLDRVALPEERKTVLWQYVLTLLGRKN